MPFKIISGDARAQVVQLKSGTSLGSKVGENTWKLHPYKQTGTPPARSTREVRRVPNVVGNEYMDARVRLINLGFLIEAIGSTNDLALVTEQEPMAGTILPTGSSIVLYTRRRAEIPST